ncbi:MAG: FAD-dependent oxidoreductase, partial [Pseudomonadota bacterium]
MSFPFRIETGPEHSAPLPAAADLVVIGGGVIGVTAALFACRAGLDVVLIEKGRVAAEQSSRNWGWVRVQGRDLAEIAIAQEAQALWRTLDAETGGALGLRQTGVTYIARTAREHARFAAWRDAALPFGVSTQMLDRADLIDLVGAVRADWIGGMHTPTDMVAEPWVAVPELARSAAAEGVRVREGCAARGLRLVGGRVTGVVTEAGTIAAPQVILAGGAWSSLFLRRHNVSIPQ